MEPIIQMLLVYFTIWFAWNLSLRCTLNYKVAGIPINEITILF